MRRRIGLVLAGVLLLTGALSGAGVQTYPAVVVVSRSTGGLEIKAQAAKGFYLPGERVWLTVTVQNTGRSTIALQTPTPCAEAVAIHLVEDERARNPEVLQRGAQESACGTGLGTLDLEPGAVLSPSFYWDSAGSPAGWYTFRVRVMPLDGDHFESDLSVRVGDFKDMADHRARATVRAAAASGLARGYTNDTFRPDAAVSRAELVIWFALLMGPNPWPRSSSPDGAFRPFVDVTNDHVQQGGYLHYAIAEGLVNPADYSDKRFQPDNAATRLDLAVFAVRALGLDSAAKALERRQTPFSKPVVEWGTGYLRVAAAQGVLVRHPDEIFRAYSPVTRAEALTILEGLREAVKARR